MGSSNFSFIQSVSCPPTVSDPPPIPVLESKSLTSIKVRWQPPTFDGGSRIIRYSLERGDGLGLPFKEVLKGNVFDFINDKLFKSTTYRFRIRAENSIGLSAYSGILTLQTHTATKVCPGGEESVACFDHGDCNADTRKCTCDEGWVLDDCTGKPCVKNCTSEVNGACNYGIGACTCNSFWEGVDCSIPNLSSLCPKCAQGNCNRATGTCTCNKGFAGLRCEMLDCTVLGQCNNHGVCVKPNVCKCSPGYLGLDCNVTSCAQLNECSGRGECISPNVCNCLPAYSGSDCSISLCKSDCSGHGLCIGKEICKCDSGYKGASCALLSCPKDCSGNGDCNDPNQCTCKDGWIGMDCGTALCPAVNNCNGRGQCSAPNVCTCIAGWGGKDCNAYKCDNDCNGRGMCVGPRSCLCSSGWSGRSCEIPDCDKVDKCSLNGNCTAPNVCECIIGWSGTKCDEPQCDRVKSCMGHGQCVYPQVCKCDDGFTGAECEQRTKPTNALVFLSPIDSVDLQRPLFSALPAFTVEAWFNITSVGARANLVSQRDVFELYVTHRYAPGQVVPLNDKGVAVNPFLLKCVIHAKGDIEIQRQLNFEPRTFHHIGVSFDGSVATLFIDGGVDSEQKAWASGPLKQSDFTVSIGGGVSNAQGTPVTAIGALRIWSKVRKDTEIQTSMIPGAPSKVPGLLGFWKFDDSFGAYAGDSGSNAITGRLVGVPEFQLVKIPQIFPPTAPAMLDHQVIDATSIRVMWDAPENNGGALVKTYYLERSLDFIHYNPVYIGPDMEFKLTSLSGSRFYAFRVMAENFAGNSTYSDVSYLTPIAGPPLPPKSAPVLISAGPTFLYVSYVRPKCNGSLLTNYTLEIMDKSVFFHFA
jgi:hypothetical protein